YNPTAPPHNSRNSGKSLRPVKSRKTPGLLTPSIVSVGNCIRVKSSPEPQRINVGRTCSRCSIWGGRRGTNYSKTSYPRAQQTTHCATRTKSRRLQCPPEQNSEGWLMAHQRRSANRVRESHAFH